MSFTAQLPHTVASSRQADSRLRGRGCSHAAAAGARRPAHTAQHVVTLASAAHRASVPCTPAPQPACSARRAQQQQHARRGAVVARAEASPAATDDDSAVVGRPNALWRVLAVLPYLVPLMGSLAFGQDMYDTYPLISWLINVFGPLLQAYYSNSFTPFFVFFALYLAVVRNEKLPHFMRFNAMQSILLDICIMLGGLIIQYMPFEIAFSTLGGICNNLVFTTGAASVFYCIWYTLQGKYADIPTVSEAVYIQVR